MNLFFISRCIWIFLTETLIKKCRVLCHAAFFSTENIITLFSIYKTAFMGI